MERYLFIAQRVSALVLAPLVLAHLGLILFAVRSGLSGAEILARTQGSAGWAVFYGLFVVSVAVHAPIGIRSVMQEWSNFPRPSINIITLLFAVVLLVLGLRAVAAVV